MGATKNSRIRRVSLRPYFCVGGHPTITDVEFAGLYWRMQRDGTADAAFFDGKVRDAESFTAEMKRGHFFLLEADVGEIGFVWLNRLERKKANAHSCAFSNAWGRPELPDIAKWVFQRILRLKTDDGKYRFDLLWGLCPVSNERAVRFAEAFSSNRLGVMPKSLCNRYGESVDAVLDCYIREEGRGFDENKYQSGN